MSKMSELSQMLDEMIACGEGMIKAANAIKDIFSSTEEAPEKKEPKSTKKATKASEPAKVKETTYLYQGRCSCSTRFQICCRI